jgi:hypothetical protein
MKKLSLTIPLLPLCLLLLGADLHAEKVFMLYGFKIGQPTRNAVNQLGPPAKTHAYENGFAYSLYRLDGCRLVITEHPTGPGLIWSIQTEGDRNPEGHGLDGINLGDPFEKVVERFGTPDSTEDSKDENTGRPIEGAALCSYLKKGNFVVERRNGRVAALKISYNGPARKREKSADAQRFLADVRSGDPATVARWMHHNFTLTTGTDSRSVATSMMHSLTHDEALRAVLFDREWGCASARETDIREMPGDSRKQAGDGTMYELTTNGARYELLFVKSHEGWMLKSLRLVR